ncbi:MAG: hypothetical protein MK060_01155 [Blastomonas sp.]|uniref:hypothetical protein n=1 Tax=Blastomonas sp. TaxID=1909299 RepID=UPI0010F51EC0|nr:hypothetical protein [Blastomonas sp.]
MDRITQNEFDAAADELLKEANYDIDKVKTNQVLIRLGKSRASGHHTSFHDSWKDRRIAEGIAHIKWAPIELKTSLAELFESIDRVACGVVGRCLAEAAEKSVRDKNKWDDQNALITESHKELKKDMEALKKENEDMLSQISTLKSALAKTTGDLDMANARLKDAHDMLQMFGLRTRNANVVESASSAPLSPEHEEVATSSEKTKRRGRPPKNRGSDSEN